MNEKGRTIVGGRSRSNRLVGNFPRGIEIMLKKAAVDPSFSQYLVQDPINAAGSIALDLKPVEINILTNTSKSVLEKMIASTRVPKQHVKTFRTATAAAMMVAVLCTTVVMPAPASAGIEDRPAQTIEQEELARSRMTVVQEALEAYRSDHGSYPSTKVWFEIPGPLSEYAPQSDFYDPWKRRFHYSAVKENGEIVNYKLESFGIDPVDTDEVIPCPIAPNEHRFTGVSPINILFPVEGYTIRISGDPVSNEGGIHLQAEHENEDVLVKWYLNGNNIGTTVKVHNLIIEPAFGKNTLLLVDENEESASIVFSMVFKRRSSDD